MALDGIAAPLTPTSEAGSSVPLLGRDVQLATSGLVKICGLRQPEHAVAAVRAGADLLGFIFAETRRRVAPEVAKSAIAAAKEAAGDRSVVAVGVFVDAGVEEIREIAAFASLDAIQLHGAEAAETLTELPWPVIKATRPRPGTPVEHVARDFARFACFENAPLLYLVDGFAAGAAGGTGVRADWDLASTLAAEWPVCLAGGLDAGSVAEAIREVEPRAVDVSSGVETNGDKDSAKIRDFIVAAKRAFAEQQALPSKHLLGRV